jgi:hypothetical protein
MSYLGKIVDNIDVSDLLSTPPRPVPLFNIYNTSDIVNQTMDEHKNLNLKSQQIVSDNNSIYNMSTIKSLFASKKALILACKAEKTHTIYFYNLVDHVVKKYNLSGDLDWQYSTIADNTPNVMNARLTNESIVFSDHFTTKQIDLEVSNYYCYLVKDGKILLCVDYSTTYLPDGTEATNYGNRAKSIPYRHNTPDDKTPHGIALFTIERYKQILKAEETIAKIMNSDI